MFFLTFCLRNGSKFNVSFGVCPFLCIRISGMHTSRCKCRCMWSLIHQGKSSPLPYHWFHPPDSRSMCVPECQTLKSTCHKQSQDRGGTVNHSNVASICEIPEFCFKTVFLYSHWGSATGSWAGSDRHWSNAFAVIMNQHSGVCMDVTVALWSTWSASGEDKGQSYGKSIIKHFLYKYHALWLSLTAHAATISISRLCSL